MSAKADWRNHMYPNSLANKVRVIPSSTTTSNSLNLSGKQRSQHETSNSLNLSGHYPHWGAQYSSGEEDESETQFSKRQSQLARRFGTGTTHNTGSTHSSYYPNKYQSQSSTSTQSTFSHMPFGGNTSHSTPTYAQSWQQTTYKARPSYFKSKDPGKRGLDNMGNTCFMNAVLQCMVHLKPLQHYFLSRQFINDLPRSWAYHKKDNILLANAFREFMRMMWSDNSNTTTIKPTAIKMLMGQLHSDYKSYEQRDSHEFFLRLIEEIGKGICYEVNINITGEAKSFADKLAVKAYERFRECNAKEYSELIRIFGGMFNNIVRRLGPKEKELSYNFETFMSVEVPIPENKTKSQNPHMNIKRTVTLMDCLEEYAKVEEIEGVTKAESIKKKISIWQLPMILVICVKRFERSIYGNFVKKIDTEVDCPFELNIGEYVTSPEQNNANYELCGVTNHMGTPQGGHYTASCRVDDKWFYFNDDDVAELKENEVVTNEAYMLFYQRKKHIDA